MPLALPPWTTVPIELSPSPQLTVAWYDAAPALVALGASELAKMPENGSPSTAWNVDPWETVALVVAVGWVVVSGWALAVSWVVVSWVAAACACRPLSAARVPEPPDPAAGLPAEAAARPNPGAAFGVAPKSAAGGAKIGGEIPASEP